MSRFETLTGLALLALSVALLILVGFSAAAWMGWFA